MTRLRQAVSAGVVWTVVGAGLAHGQFADWTTGGFDAQRSHWLRGDTKITPESMRKPGFDLVWKSAVNPGKRGQYLLTAPVLLDFYISYRGFRSLAFMGSATNTVVAFDSDLGRLEWKKDLVAAGGAAPQPTAMCPGGMTAAVTRPGNVGYPPATGGRGMGRGNPAKSGVGEPFEGSVTLRAATNAPPAPPPAAPPKGAVASARRVATTPSSPFAPRVQFVFALGSDGKFHSMYVSNGDEPKPGIPFIPANAYAKGLVVLDNVAYVATTNGCGGVDNGVWALDLQSQKVSQWKASANVAGSAGLAAGPDGTIYATAGGELVALEERTLKHKSSYKIGQQFTSSPLIFEFKGKDLIAAVSNDGKLHLVDAAKPEAAIATSTFASADTPTAALASWADAAGNRWILSATSGAPVSGLQAGNGPVKNGAVVAWKVVDQGGVPGLQPGWVSRDMMAPVNPIVVNGVVFAVASGEYRPGDEKVTLAQRSQRSSPAVLYALDSATGKELWSSGKSMTTYVTSGGLAAGGSRVYVATQDGTQYVYGFPIEH